METRIALLRGVNVSGKNLVDMKQLVQWMREAGFKDPQSYIQSGNLLYQTDHPESGALLSGILKNKLGIDVPAIVLEPDQLQQIIHSHPALKATETDRTKVYYSFLGEEPSAAGWEKLSRYSFESERWFPGERMVYFYAGNGYGKARMNNNFFESKLGVTATTRNLNTCIKLLEISRKTGS